MNKQLYLLFLALSTLFFFQCENNNGTNSSAVKNLTNNQYVKGKVIIPANSIYKTGLLRAYIKENADPKRLRGIVYQRENDQSFELHEEVFFKVVERNGMQLATELTRSDKSEELFKARISYDMNLHVSHFEDAVHTKVHIVRPPSGGNFTILNSSDGTSLTVLEVYNVPSSGVVDSTDTRNILIYTDAVNSLDLTKNYYMSQINRIDNKVIYGLDLNHVHLYE